MTDYKTTSFTKNDSESVRDFLALPKRLYKPTFRTQDEKSEAQLIAGTHALSPDLNLQFFLTRNEQGVACARGVLTRTPDPSVAYFGFVEMIDDYAAWSDLFKTLSAAAKVADVSRLIGPVNGSLWLGYRVKTDHFNEAPYTLESYQHAYYYDFFKRSGLVTTDVYSSNFYPVPPKDYALDALYEKVVARMDKNGTEIKTLRDLTWDTARDAVEALVSVLFADFPTYQALSHEQFVALFNPLGAALDPDMVQIVMKKDQAVGFLVALPDYHNWLSQPLPWHRKLRILWRRRHAKRFVIGYMGALPANSGIGLGMVERLQKELAKRGADSIGSLIHDGKASGRYLEKEVVQKNHYALMAKELN